MVFSLALAAVLLEVTASHGRSYVCVETSDRILIGQRRATGRMQGLAGKRVSVSHDDRSLWIALPNGRRIKFRQEYLTPAFAPHSPCERVVDAAIKRHNSPPSTTLLTR